MNEFGKFTPAPTLDGSITLYAHEFGEAMHSRSGAYEESLYKHVYPSRVFELGKPRIQVLDIGFGIGYNCLALLHELVRSPHSHVIEIISLEKDLSALHLMKQIHFHDERDHIYKALLQAAEHGSFISEHYRITIMQGDARALIRILPENRFDAIFQDAFSPAKNPELWSVEYFRELFRVIAPHGILTTYSSAKHIRMAMLEAGFHIGRGPSVGGKREGTLASISREIPFLTNSELLILGKDISASPYRDEDLKDTRENILRRRLEIIAKAREGHQARG